MAYTVGQLRKDNISTPYMTAIEDNITIVPIETYNPFAAQEQGSYFKDLALQRTNEQMFNVGQSYYFRFSISEVQTGFYSKCIPLSEQPLFMDADVLIYNVLLTNGDAGTGDMGRIESTTQIQQLQSFRVPTKVSSQKQYYTKTIVFTPNANYKYLVFKLTRTAYDALIGFSNGDETQKARDWLFDHNDGWENNHQIYIEDTQRDTFIQDTGERFFFSGEKGDLCILNNILPQGKQNLLKIGYQARPGSLILVNNEPIRIGRSGIYEVNNGTKITSFMITAPNGDNPDNIDAFLLDYAYNT